jgi:hypothetical protein
MNERVIFSCFEIFGSGTCCVYYRQVDNDLRKLIEFLRAGEIHPKETSGNGFVGTNTVPASLAREYGVETDLICSPGRERPRGGQGWVTHRMAFKGFAKGETLVDRLLWPPGLPANAPEWAKQEFWGSDHCSVSHDDGFTVVRHFERRETSSKEQTLNVFATRDGVGDHTKQYQRVRYNRARKEALERYRRAGLTPLEAERLFEVGRAQWAREFETPLVDGREVFRKNKLGLVQLAKASSHDSQTEAIDEHQLPVNLSHNSWPRRQEFAKRALWVFFGIRDASKENPFPTSGKGWSFNPAKRG